VTAPIYAAPAGALPQPRWRLLLISAVFPPDRTVGAQRWQKMLPILMERGWASDVITMAPETPIDAAGRAALNELDGTRVYAVDRRPLPTRALERAALAVARSIRRPPPQPPSPESRVPSPAIPAPHVPSIPVPDIKWHLTHPRGWMRAYYGWAEHAEVLRWSRAAARLAVTLGRATRYDVIITSSPPHMTHEAGRLAAQQLALPLVLDLRDPWSLSDRLYEMFASPLWLREARRYERRVVDAAALVVANTEPFATAMAARYPRARRVIAITNGADMDPLPPARPPARFTIRYAGTIYSERDPVTLFEAAGRVVRELALTPAEFGIDLIGEAGDTGGGRLLALAHAAGVDAFTTVGPRRPRREALEFLAGASMLVSFPNFSESVAISAKLFEYMRYDAWLLVLASPGSAARQLLAGTNADVASPTDPAEAAAHIARRVRAHQRGEKPVALARETRFTRRFQAWRLADALDALVVAPS
jgi:glycosyltransferase involved in cell wall biosynthesis